MARRLRWTRLVVIRCRMTRLLAAGRWFGCLGENLTRAATQTRGQRQQGGGQECDGLGHERVHCLIIRTVVKLVRRIAVCIGANAWRIEQIGLV